MSAAATPNNLNSILRILMTERDHQHPKFSSDFHMSAMMFMSEHTINGKKDKNPNTNIKDISTYLA